MIAKPSDCQQFAECLGRAIKGNDSLMAKVDSDLELRRICWLCDERREREKECLSRSSYPGS